MFRSFVIAFVLCVSNQTQEQSFEETFSRVSPTRWDVQLHAASQIEVRNNEVLLKNRPYLLTKADYDKAAEYEIQWTWEDQQGGRQFADNLLILLRTTGKTAEERSFETLDGLRVRVDAGHGKVSLDYVVEGKGKVLAERYVRLRDSKLEHAEKEFDDKDVALPEGAGSNWYTVLVKDDGKKIAVSLNGTEIITAEYDASKLPGKKFGVGNREEVGGFPQVSYIRKIVATRK